MTFKIGDRVKYIGEGEAGEPGTVVLARSPGFYDSDGNKFDTESYIVDWDDAGIHEDYAYVEAELGKLGVTKAELAAAQLSYTEARDARRALFHRAHESGWSFRAIGDAVKITGSGIWHLLHSGQDD
jgi:hypothetical protein